MVAIVLAVWAVVGLPAAASAWHATGHRAVARRAADRADQLPAFFREQAGVIADICTDPDLFTERGLAPQLRDAEGPEQYMDLELLGGEELPQKRSEFVALCMRKGVHPQKVGTAPYATIEWTQRLTLAMAQLRHRPDDPVARWRVLVYAGLLAHYAADLCQPLHTTVDFDGRVGPDGNTPRSGIHAKMDELPGRLGDLPWPMDGSASPADDLPRRVFDELARSHALVDRVYELEGELPPHGKLVPAGSDIERFTLERMEAATQFLADLYATAWRNSADVTLPAWAGEGQAASALAAATQPTEAADDNFTLGAVVAVAMAALVAGILVGSLLSRRGHR